MKKVLGALLIMVVFGILFATTTMTVGFVGAILAWSTAVALTAVSVLGVFLLTSR